MRPALSSDHALDEIRRRIAYHRAVACSGGADCDVCGSLDAAEAEIEARYLDELRRVRSAA